jgi:hypothetical protein
MIEYKFCLSSFKAKALNSKNAKAEALNSKNAKALDSKNAKIGVQRFSFVVILEYNALALLSFWNTTL